MALSNVILAEETYEILGACFDVYTSMGCGFLERVYHECLIHAFVDRKIDYLSEPVIPLRYREHTLSTGYRPDFVCLGRIVVEVKALPALLPEHRAQIINYLNAGPFPVGLLTNFGHYPKLEFERFVLTPALQRNRKGNTGYGK